MSPAGGITFPSGPLSEGALGCTDMSDGDLASKSIHVKF